jgi:magnesium chelatase subunit I
LNDIPIPPVFPFAALIAQAPLQQALLLVAVDPALGGVLITGPRGTAKSTTARALAELLPEGRMVTLPLGASEEQLIGTLDLEVALRDGGVRFSPGLLSRAHRGVLYVDEVNLLPNPLVDQLLDVAGSGVNVIERDGISYRHEARFVLIGTMNPEEGELRPQLLDRFGLAVQLENCFDAGVRRNIVKSRLAFDMDPEGFRSRFVEMQNALSRRITDARAALDGLELSDAVHARVSELCIAAQVDGLRADLVMVRTARALAAFEAADAVSTQHVERVAEPVLMHRQKERGVRGRSDSEASKPPPRGNGGDGDQGYLPPEPVETATIKNVRPLNAKKS